MQIDKMPVQIDKMPPTELTVTEAVNFSGYTRCHVYNLITSRKLKSRRVKPRGAPIIILIEKQSLELYMYSKGRSVNGEQANHN